MATAYFIGGPPRTGKTTAAERFLSQHPMTFMATDTIRAGLRNALIGASYINMEQPLTLAVQTAYSVPGSKAKRHVQHTSTRTEDALTWDVMKGIIDEHDREEKDLLVEGMVFDPEQLFALGLGNISVRAAFVGYTDESYGDTILKNARLNNDWVGEWLEDEGSEAPIRQWVAEQAQRSRMIEASAAEYGYGYFDVTQRSLDDHVGAVLEFIS